MGDLSWKIKQFCQKLMPFAMIALVAYGAHYAYKHRTFRHGIGSGVRSLVYKIPYFGSRFKRGSRKHYAHSKRRYGRRHGHYRHNRHSRRHRRHR